VPGRNYFAVNFGDSCVIPEITRHAELVSASYYFFAAVLNTKARYF
jgi:hypothetical protein